MATLYIITGPNGAGKSTAGPGLLPDLIRDQYPPFDGDKLMMRKQIEFKKQSGSYKEARNLANEFVFKEFERLYTHALDNDEHFSYEGHFSEPESWHLIEKFKQNGYRTEMIFLGLKSLQLSMDRVLHRAKKGGHNVQPYDIEKNFYGNLMELNRHLPLLDQLTLLDTSGVIPIYIGQWINGTMHFHLTGNAVPLWVSNHLTGLFPADQL